MLNPFVVVSILFGPILIYTMYGVLLCGQFTFALFNQIISQICYGCWLFINKCQYIIIGCYIIGSFPTNTKIIVFWVQNHRCSNGIDR